MKELSKFNPVISDEKYIIFFGKLFITIRCSKNPEFFQVKVYRDADTKPLHLTFGTIEEVVNFIEIISEYRQGDT